MYADLLVSLVYDEHSANRGDGEIREEIIAPKWEDVVFAIRRLDRRQFYFVQLWLKDHGHLRILGGKGIYYLSVDLGAYFERRLFFADKEAVEVQVYDVFEKDRIDSRYLVDDVETVLYIAKYFFDQADFAPDVPWEPDETAGKYVLED